MHPDAAGSSLQGNGVHGPVRLGVVHAATHVQKM